jgi:hypothetical protein
LISPFDFHKVNLSIISRKTAKALKTPRNHVERQEESLAALEKLGDHGVLGGSNKRDN